LGSAHTAKYWLLLHATTLVVSHTTQDMHWTLPALSLSLSLSLSFSAYSCGALNLAKLQNFLARSTPTSPRVSQSASEQVPCCYELPTRFVACTCLDHSPCSCCSRMIGEPTYWQIDETRASLVVPCHRGVLREPSRVSICIRGWVTRTLSSLAKHSEASVLLRSSYLQISIELCNHLCLPSA
jgi:hypothetical protein